VIDVKVEDLTEEQKENQRKRIEELIEAYLLSDKMVKPK
jgi:hypothetical protein